MCAFRAMTRRLELKCPDFGRKTIRSQMGHYLEYCSLLPAFIDMLLSIIEVANAYTEEWNHWPTEIEK